MDNTSTSTDKIEEVLFHIQNVQKNCYALGLKLIKLGKTELGRNLIANGQIHDNSKFKGIEFEHLFEGSPFLADVARHHSSTNPHHPEYWGDIKEMPDVYLAEMVCDISARASEFGTDVRQWVKDSATIKYGFQMDDEVGLKLEYFLNILLKAPFKKLS